MSRRRCQLTNYMNVFIEKGVTQTRSDVRGALQGFLLKDSPSFTPSLHLLNIVAVLETTSYHYIISCRVINSREGTISSEERFGGIRLAIWRNIIDSGAYGSVWESGTLWQDGWFFLCIDGRRVGRGKGEGRPHVLRPSRSADSWTRRASQNLRGERRWESYQLTKLTRYFRRSAFEWKVLISKNQEEGRRRTTEVDQRWSS